MSKFAYFKKTKPIKGSRLHDAGIALYAFAIANVVLWIGNLVYAITTGDSLLLFDLLEFDLSIILLYASFVQIVDNLQMLAFAVLGWILASFWVRLNYPKNYATIIVYSVIIPFMFLPTIIIISIINLSFGGLQLGILEVGIFIAFAVIILNVAALAIAIPGIILAGFFNPRTVEKTKMVAMVDYLVLLEPIPPNPNEKVVYCPFRMKNKPGCAYLGYKAPELPLICDYQSTWQMCYVYTHLYYKLKVLE